MPKRNLEGIVLRDRIAGIGLIGGSAIALMYSLTTKDREGALFITYAAGMGALMGSGVGYCVGTVLRAFYEGIKFLERM